MISFFTTPHLRIANPLGRQMTLRSGLGPTCSLLADQNFANPNSAERLAGPRSVTLTDCEKLPVMP
jgi:hypothetical protein